MNKHELRDHVKGVRHDFLNDVGDSAYCIQEFDSLGFLVRYFCNNSSYGGFELSENYMVYHHLKGSSNFRFYGGCSRDEIIHQWKYNLLGNRVTIKSYNRRKLESKKTLYFDRMGRKTKSISVEYSEYGKKNILVEENTFSSLQLKKSIRYNILNGKKLYRTQSFYDYDTSGYLIKVANLYYDNGIFNDTVFTFYSNDQYGNMIKHRTWSNKDKRKFGGNKSYEYDSRGNWTKLIVMDTTGKPTSTINRRIEYY